MTRIRAKRVPSYFYNPNLPGVDVDEFARGDSLAKNEKPCKNARRPLWVKKKAASGQTKRQKRIIERVEIRIGSVGGIQKPCPNIHGES